jgi:hydrogenase nickel incorporation protein HypA/HybF
MHELSIAQNIVEIVDDEVLKAKGKKIEKLILEVGTMSGIIREALEFALDEAIKHTILENSQIEIIEIQGIAKCEKCNFEFKIDEMYSACPSCSHLYSTIIKGNELKIKSIIIEK